MSSSTEHKVLETGGFPSSPSIAQDFVKVDGRHLMVPIHSKSRNKDILFSTRTGVLERSSSYLGRSLPLTGSPIAQPLKSVLSRSQATASPRTALRTSQVHCKALPLSPRPPTPRRYRHQGNVNNPITRNLGAGIVGPISTTKNLACGPRLISGPTNGARARPSRR